MVYMYLNGNLSGASWAPFQVTSAWESRLKSYRLTYKYIPYSFLNYFCAESDARDPGLYSLVCGSTQLYSAVVSTAWFIFLSLAWCILCWLMYANLNLQLPETDNSKEFPMALNKDTFSLSEVREGRLNHLSWAKAKLNEEFIYLFPAKHGALWDCT